VLFYYAPTILRPQPGVIEMRNLSPNQPINHGANGGACECGVWHKLRKNPLKIADPRQTPDVQNNYSCGNYENQSRTT
jgi:hypothetical protein